MLANSLRYTLKSSTVRNELSCRNIGLQASVNLEHVACSKAGTVLGQANGAFVRLAKSNHYNWRICKHPGESEKGLQMLTDQLAKSRNFHLEKASTSHFSGLMKEVPFRFHLPAIALKN
jgi:hypothetical protein